MSRYIDAEWLEDNAKEYSLGYYEVDEWATPLNILDSAPSIDIVRCKDCKNKYEWDSGCGAELVCKARRCDPGDWGRDIEFYVKPYDFCSYGEREGD